MKWGGSLKLRKVLIANRGEIACRVMRTAKRLGIATVAIYSDADAKALHVKEAGEAVHIGPSPAAESYLRIDAIIAAAKAKGADCVHPGYGFLSENAEFAEACAAAGLTFVGPSPGAMRELGDKSKAKALAEKLAIPVVPGWRGEGQEPKLLAREAARIGFPVMIKAAAGGGGRGMRAVTLPEDFAAALDSAVREATASFGDGRVLLEKLIACPRHIEVQIFGDSHGNVVHMFERDCSLQRRHQKVIEEAPAPGMSEGLRAKLTEAAVRLAKAARYEGAGTVEFLIEGGNLAPDATFYFIEVNTRLQVEHPVTEEVTGLDLVEWQFRVAASEPLPRRQDAIKLSGHAIEARLCAEDPAGSFLPSTGRLVACDFEPMDGLRIETAVGPGDEVTAYYDSMIAKLVAHAETREEALDNLARALDRSRVMGPKTNARLLEGLTSEESVRKGVVDTGLIGRRIEHLAPSGLDRHAIRLGVHRLLEQAAGTVAKAGQTRLPWQSDDSFELGSGRRRQAREIVVDGTVMTAEIVWGLTGPEIAIRGLGGDALCAPAGDTHIVADDGRVLVLHDLRQTIVAWPVHGRAAGASADDGRSVIAPITGRVAKVLVASGDRVKKADVIAIVEAMKMEHVLHARCSGVIRRLAVQEGQQVAQGVLIAELDIEEAP